MNGQEEVLVCGSTNCVGREDKFQRKDWGVTQTKSTGDLQCNDSEHKVFGQRLWPAELDYLWREALARTVATDPRVFHTSGCALMIACLRVLCGSSV